ncbi:hypothetical protein I541_5766 [Mycobacteroides abscessus]|nr:hypothetical protein I541_5766 [Mycobacteroides abscessus]
MIARPPATVIASSMSGGPRQVLTEGGGQCSACPGSTERSDHRADRTSTRPMRSPGRCRGASVPNTGNRKKAPNTNGVPRMPAGGFRLGVLAFCR